MNEIAITNDNFKSLVLQSELPVLVDFWASWCMPCRMIAPVVAEIAQELAGKAVVAKLDVDECSDLASRYGVMSIPTLMVFDKGDCVEKSIGVQPKETILAMLEKHIK